MTVLCCQDCGHAGLNGGQHAGANLDPMRVLESLGEEMPLGLAFPTLARIQRERLHRRRHTSVIRSLTRSVGLAAAATRAQVNFFESILSYPW